MKAAQLGCEGHAQAGAEALELAFPVVFFTSGRRRYQDQARAMSQNVEHNRQWIVTPGLYRSSRKLLLQAWIDGHPLARTAAAIEAGLTEVMSSWTQAELESLSRHMGGRAWDVQPLAPGRQASAVKAFIQALPGLNAFLTREGSYIRWHAQFN